METYSPVILRLRDPPATLGWCLGLTAKTHPSITLVCYYRVNISLRWISIHELANSVDSVGCLFRVGIDRCGSGRMVVSIYSISFFLLYRGIISEEGNVAHAESFHRMLLGYSGNKTCICCH